MLNDRNRIWWQKCHMDIDATEGVQRYFQLSDANLQTSPSRTSKTKK